jgi:hypothetical protein
VILRIIVLRRFPVQSWIVSRCGLVLSVSLVDALEWLFLIIRHQFVSVNEYGFLVAGQQSNHLFATL